MIPPPQASSTPKKQAGGSVLFRDALAPPPTPAGRRQATDESPLKKRKVAYMDENEDIGDTLSISGRTLTPYNISNRVTKATKRFGALQEQRAQLPITKGKAALLRECKENDAIVLVGETGSGKTTQISQYLLESNLCGQGQIAVTQPRRVAATSLASRVAQEQGCELGNRVGYAVRFDEKHNSSTKIKYMTDGMLLREMLSDPLLLRYNVIIVDEAHERTLNSDILLAGLKRIQKQRKRRAVPTGKGKGKDDGENYEPLKVIIMSATLDAEKFSQFFDGAKVLYVKGRQHPVKIYYTVANQADYVDAALRTFFQIHIDNPPGDILIFLPGQEDIESLHHAIDLYSKQLPVGKMDVVTCVMYAALPQNMQSRVFEAAPSGSRKCILATNIAETSITIPGIRYVIDTGKHKEKRHFARTGGRLDTLTTEDISKSSAMQRAGRAGREGSGSCYRLYTEDDFKAMTDAISPEILRCSLMSTALQLKCLGQDIQELDLMDRPDDEAVKTALMGLYHLGALDGQGKLTDIGRTMNNFPLEPSLARAVLAANEHDCLRGVLGIVSVLSASSSLFYDTAEQREAAAEARLRFRHPSGDHLTSLNALRAYEDLQRGGATKNARKEWCRSHFVNERTLKEAIDIQEQLQVICRRLKMDAQSSSSDRDEPVLKALLYGLVQNVAVYRPGEKLYKSLLSPSLMKIHPSSVLSGQKHHIIMYDELLFTQQKYARGVSVIKDMSLIVQHPAFRR